MNHIHCGWIVTISSFLIYSMSPGGVWTWSTLTSMLHVNLDPNVKQSLIPSWWTLVQIIIFVWPSVGFLLAFCYASISILFQPFRLSGPLPVHSVFEEGYLSWLFREFSVLFVNVGSVWPSAELCQLNIYVICHELSQIFTNASGEGMGESKSRHEYMIMIVIL